MTTGEPTDPFTQQQQFYPETLMENAASPGPATELAGQADNTLGRWSGYVDDIGRLQLSTFTGAAVEVQREDLLAGRELQPYRPVETPEAAPAIRGLRKWLGWLGRVQRSPEAQIASSHYRIKLVDDRGTFYLKGTRLPHMNNSVHFAAEQDTGTSGRKSIALENDDLVDAVTRATEVINNGFPLSVETAIAENQAKPCTRIIGNEAIDVQRAVSVLTEPTWRPGDKNSQQTVTKYGVMNPRLDGGQWSVASVTHILRDGRVTPNIPGAPDSSSLLTFVRFSSETINTIGGRPTSGPLMVRVEGAYQPDGRLAAAQVSYFTVATDGESYPVAVDPDERRVIHTAIANQIDPDNLGKLQ